MKFGNMQILNYTGQNLKLYLNEDCTILIEAELPKCIPYPQYEKKKFKDENFLFPLYYRNYTGISNIPINDDKYNEENTYIIIPEEVRTSFVPWGSLVKGNCPNIKFITPDLSDSKLDEDGETIIFHKFICNY